MRLTRIYTREYQLLAKDFVKWLQQHNISEATLYNHRNKVRDIFAFLESQEQVDTIKKLQPVHIYNYYQHLLERENKVIGGALAANTINGIVLTIYQLLRYLRLTHGYTITVKIPRLKEKKKTKDILTIKEISCLLDSIDLSDDEGYRDRAVIGLIYGAGLRKGEVEGLKIDDVSFQDGIVHVRKGKGRKERFVPITDKILGYVHEYIIKYREFYQDMFTESTDHLFIEERGKPLLEWQLYKLLRHAIENSGIKSIQKKRITLHSLRHSIATHLLQQGMELEDIALFLGHEKLDTTMIYTHIQNGSV